MNEILDKVRDYVIKGALAQPGGAMFIENHIKPVVKNAEYILDTEPLAQTADRVVVMTASWLHDIQRVDKPDEIARHEEVGAEIAAEVLKSFGASDELIAAVYDCVLCHEAETRQPKTIEAKILCTADAMAHFSTDFYLSLFLYVLKKYDVAGFKKFALGKLEKDMNGGRIFFDGARSVVLPVYEKIKAFFEM